MGLNEYQIEVLNKLVSGELTKTQFSTMRSAARRYNKLERSIELAVVFEVYKSKLSATNVPLL